jgi:hypothetical protein
MKKLFNKKVTFGKKAKVAPPKSHVKFPYSQPANQGNNDQHKSSDDKKTRIGKQPDSPYESKNGMDNLICPKCQYPLRIEPSASSPCPNCGFMGSTGLHDTVSDSKKTISLNGLNLQDEQKLSSFRFKLISESTGSEFKIESEENEIVLNRDHLDPNNTSISSKEHVLVRFRDGKIFFQDISTNGSTFIQVINKMLINPGTRIVMGNRIFLFSHGQTLQDTDNSKATRQLSMVNMDKDNIHDFVLIEENSGRRIQLNQGFNLLNRTNLDPGNASISGDKHATLEFKDGQWYVSDLSSNAATFIQCKTEHQMADKIRIIIGNIIFRFEYD